VLRLLDASSEAALKDARGLLAELRDELGQFGLAGADQTALIASIRQLDEMFLLVVVGEFNAGKSALINALLGETILREGVTPTTAQIQLITHGEAVTEVVQPDAMRVITAPVALLRDLQIVDTPGTNAIVREHERLTADFVPRADLVLFVTSADRPFTQSERVFMESIRDWGKKIVIVLNKIDIFASPHELDEVVAFVAATARQVLGVESDVLPVSARLAYGAKHGHPEQWVRSRFEALERYLSHTLDAPRRFRLKLANPLGVGAALATRYSGIAAERVALIAEDIDVLADVERQLTIYRADMDRGFELRMAAVEKELAHMETRGRRFFEDTLRIGRVMDLLNRARIQKEFEDEVIADAPVQIERRVSELIDWLVDQDFRQWQAVTSRLSGRQRHHAPRVLGAPEVGTFHNDRSRLIDSVGREAQRVVDTYDRRREAAAIADQARVSVAAAAAAGGAALGLGTIVTIAASTVAADVTGILLASVVLGIGFLVIPARRRQATATLAEKITALRARLSAALTAEFDRAREQSGLRLADSVAPYARFVRAEEERWGRAHQALNGVTERMTLALARLAQRNEPA
jgi:small GTP-binding protein